jgi:hypothetical protein
MNNNKLPKNLPTPTGWMLLSLGQDKPLDVHIWIPPHEPVSRSVREEIITEIVNALKDSISLEPERCNLDQTLVE